MQVTLQKKPFKMSFYFDGKYLTGSDTKQLAHITTPEGIYTRERLEVSPKELYYGLGERFGPLVKNGQSIDIWNEDGGTSSELSYKNIPFCLSNRGYGIFVNHTDRVSFEIASEAVSKNQFSVPGEYLHYYIIGGGSMRKALANYTSLTGKPVLPPYWSFGLWLSTSFTTDYDETTVTEFINGMEQRGIPLSVFHFDCFWMKEYEWCNFSWDEKTFTEVKPMLSRLKQRGSDPDGNKGLRVCVWINPYIGQKSPLFDEAVAGGYLLRKLNGDIWQWDMWQPGMGIVDFTNPDAVIWFQSKLSALLDLGVTCFKTDFGERIPVDAVYYNGADPQKMHNYYTFLYNKAVYELLKEKKGKNQAVLFARSATTGSQQFPVHWGGDSFASYQSMAETIRGGLSLASSGFAFWSHDIGGFESTSTPDLYKRWLAFGLLTTHSRLHGSNQYRVPWLFDEESVDVLRFFTKLKLSLMPYIFAQSVQSCSEGIGVMRIMALMFPDDPICGYLDLQYMLGDNLLIAPVFNENKTCEYYLPSGVFTHLISGKKRAGGRFYSESIDYFDIPIYVKENSIIIKKDESPDILEAHVYELTNSADAFIYNKNGSKRAKVSAYRRDGVYNFDIEYYSTDLVAPEFTLILHNISPAIAKTKSKAALKQVETSQPGTAFAIPNGENHIIITV
jgi:alpha-D-xyloside xylohydrolase